MCPFTSHFLSIVLLAAATTAQVRELPSPAGPRSGQPNLTTTPTGDVALSWVERQGDGHVLRFATRRDDGWSRPQTIAAGENWFVNWADFPSLVVLPDGAMAAHWLVKSGEGTYDYDVAIARSTDGGDTWSTPLVPHRDGVRAEHGFVSLFAGRDGVLSAAWLDGREMAKASGAERGDMTLRFVEIGRDGELLSPALLDARVCECCQTSAAMTANGPAVVYRDRSQDEIRDISIVRLVEGTWTEPRPVSDDDWEVHGCPVNGPSIAAAGNRVAVAWFTAAAGRARVLLALSEDAGASFAAPLTIDANNPAGRTEVLALEDGTVWLCWLAQQPRGAVMACRIDAAGAPAPTIKVADTATARRNGFPQLARHGDELVFAWTDRGIQTAVMPLR